MDVKTMADFQSSNEQPEVLFWVGCAGSFDARAQKVTKAMCQILQKAGISYAILGNEEACTGDPARRAGNEFVFQMLAIQNIETLNMYNVQKIVTACPHCFNTLKNEYPELGGNYQVLHHSQFLKELLDQGKIKLSNEPGKTEVSYHDSCYLGRMNGEYTAPRDVINALSMEIKELKRSRKDGMCCGAGGAQMFKEDEVGKARINNERTKELIETGAKMVVANCPFCITMITDGLKAKDLQDEVMVYDLSELIVQKIM